jgi:hypothetical protein
MIEQFSSHVLKTPSIAESSFSNFDEFEGQFSFEGELSGKSNDASNGSNEVRFFFETILGRGWEAALHFSGWAARQRESRQYIWDGL